MKLVATPTSPYARKVRVALAEKNIPFELVVDSPWEPTSTVPEVNPLGKVPVLITDDGETFFDSPVIVAWLETLGADPRLIPADAREAVRVRQLEGLADGITDATVAIVLEGRRPEDKRSEDVIGRQLQKIERGLDRLEQLASGRTWLHGDHMSIGDIAAAVTAGFIELRVPHVDWRAGRPALTTLVERMFERDSFKDTVPPAG
ncbi:glutathione S-transferase [Pseudazoarcus pumilus]|uniref:Glutathione S-transferase n=1 Tax=Pseudazoarcus pumilus TaxID=2067960 RepID=A0A2I6S3I2_9RHOO|nr:glutathione S-transferase [Pseudazoarcus pumilus]AUN93821.1 glutathione S-transferase [Pseudazoarcus pumilus]